jgi:uncharacterized protein with ATP-grasp and redox domains
MTQALRAGTAAGASGKARWDIMKRTAALIAGHSADTPPPYLGKAVQDAVMRFSRNRDPYLKEKEKYNRTALKYYPALKKEVLRSKERLLAAVKVAITGNVIDFGSDWKFDIHSEIKNIFRHKPAVFDYREFKSALSKAKNILFLGDNAGETVFDRVLVETMKELYPVEVVYAVKEKPILNDALLKDAVFAGLHKCAKIISSGSSLPGTPTGGGTKEFLLKYNSADIIISKGMGNFELLDTEKRPIFFMLKAKCPVVAAEIGTQLGSMVLKMQKSGFARRLTKGRFYL